MRLDAHQHFWKYDAAEYPWIPAGSPLHRDWLPDDLAPLLCAAGLDGCIAVQARQSLEESRWLLELADKHPVIRGVVGWVDLRSDRMVEQLTPLAAHPRFKGVRHVAQDEPDDSFLARPEFVRGVKRLPAFGLRYDVLIYPRQLPAATALVDAAPEVPFVLDHLAKPAIRDGALEPWLESFRKLARRPNVTCKVSGLVTEARRDWRAEDFRPYLDAAFEAFGPRRLMFGSDWPVCRLATEYPEIVRLVKDYLEPLPAADREAVLGGTAANFYGVEA